MEHVHAALKVAFIVPTVLHMHAMSVYAACTASHVKALADNSVLPMSRVDAMRWRREFCNKFDGLIQGTWWQMDSVKEQYIETRLISAWEEPSA